MQYPAVDLFHAYTQNLLPPQGGYLVCGRQPVAGAPIRYTIARLHSVQEVTCPGSGLSIRAEGEILEFIIPEAPASPPTPSELVSRPLPKFLVIDSLADRDFAFLFPADGAAEAALHNFLEKTFIAESSLSPEQGRQTARDIVSRLIRKPEGSP